MKRCCAVLLASALLWGCGDDGSGSSCVETGKRICRLAVDCNGSTAVIAAGAVTVEHDTQAMCENYYSFLSCTDEQRASADYSACNLALDSAQCIDTNKGTALDLPVACGSLAM